MANNFQMYTTVYKSLMKILNELDVIHKAASGFCKKFEKEPMGQASEEGLVIRSLDDIKKDLTKV